MELRPEKPIELFYSYSHKDEELRVEIEKHLGALKRQGVINHWNYQKIDAGKAWSVETNDHLHSAQIILLLISADFIDSDYCTEIEVHAAMKRYSSQGTVVIPILLRPVIWDGLSFSKLNALPSNGQPITSWANQDAAFKNVAEGISEIASKIKSEEKTEPEQVSQKESLVIVVEDNERWRRRIGSLLIQKGCNVETYADFSEQLLVRLQKNDYALLIIDLRLNELDIDSDSDKPITEIEKKGKDLIAFVRMSRHTAEIPIIIVSGWAELDDLEEALNKYNIHHFENKKKWSAANFLIAVDKALNNDKNS